MSKTGRSLGEGGPIEIRYRLAYDGKLLSDVLAVFLRVVRGWYFRKAKEAGYKDMRCGSVTHAGKFGSSLNLNPHFHVLHLDGVYANNKGGDIPVFLPAPELNDEDVKALVETTAHRVIGLLKRRGILDGDQYDELADESPILAGVTAASVQGMIATGERAGLPVRRVLSDPAEIPTLAPARAPPQEEWEFRQSKIEPKRRLKKEGPKHRCLPKEVKERHLKPHPCL